MKEVYRVAAPATVIIRVPNGMGSGVIIDPKGWVLTNEHVIANGKAEDFLITVSLMMGELSKDTGAMDHREKVYKAEVYKADKLRDIALLKIIDPPKKKLPFVKLAGKKPVPGDKVTSLGHAGAGMLWAIKSGEIATLGKMSEHLATLARFKDNEEGKKAKKEFKKYLDKKNLGVVIQSSCGILPGDSGGPLLNQAGHIVGLNAFSRKDYRTGGLLSFHVHIGEIQKFLKDWPKKPRRMVPDPWAEGGGDLSYEDANLDGRVDMLVMQGRRPCSFCPRQSMAAFFDIDQDSFKGAKKLPELEKVFDKRSFDAEVVFLQIEGNAFIWYDTDNDGSFDALLYDKYTSGYTDSGYKLAKDGDLKKNPSWDRGRVFRPKLFATSSLGERLVPMARATFPSRYTDSSAPLSKTLPKPIAAAGKADFRDLNRDGHKDAIDLSTAFTKRLLIDVDQNSIPKFKGKLDMSDPAQRKKLDVEVAIISQSTHMWVFYDTDDDGNFDLVLHSPGSRLYVAAEAWDVKGGGKKTVPEHIGRKLMRPAIFKQPTHSQALKSMVGRGLLRIMSAKDDGISSFPDPIKDHRGAGYELAGLKSAPRAVVTVVGRGSEGFLIDLDTNSLGFKPIKKIKIRKVIKEDKFETEFAYFQRNGIAWTYYDTNNDGKYDVVFVALKPSSGKATSGFRIDKTGKTTLDPKLANKPLVQHSLFKNFMLRGRMKKLAKDLFAANMVEK